jgi:hypothetical protein
MVFNNKKTKDKNLKVFKAELEDALEILKIGKAWGGERGFRPV